MLSLKEIAIVSSEATEHKVKCECGHSVLIPKRKDKHICSHCGNYVFRTKEDEYRYRLHENLIKQKKKYKLELM